MNSTFTCFNISWCCWLFGRIFMISGSFGIWKWPPQLESFKISPGRFTSSIIGMLVLKFELVLLMNLQILCYILSLENFKLLWPTISDFLEELFLDWNSWIRDPVILGLCRNIYLVFNLAKEDLWMLVILSWTILALLIFMFWRRILSLRGNATTLEQQIWIRVKSR